VIISSLCLNVWVFGCLDVDLYVYCLFIFSIRYLCTVGGSRYLQLSQLRVPRQSGTLALCSSALLHAWSIGNWGTCRHAYRFSRRIDSVQMVSGLPFLCVDCCDIMTVWLLCLLFIYNAASSARLNP